MKVCTVAEMRELDRRATEEFGLSEALLMENAGQAAYSVLRDRVGVRDRKFVAVCGVGNNGGDGFVVARKIHADGGDVRVYILGARSKFKGAARSNLEILVRLPVTVKDLGSPGDLEREFEGCDAIVDAIFGTGLVREVQGTHREVIEAINRSGRSVLSVDIPSGVNGDNGRIMGAAVRAHWTVTFGLPKIGNLLFPGFERCGKLYVTHISFPPCMHRSDSLKIEINHPPALRPRDPSGHKGTFGDALFIAGSSNYLGAPSFAALSFLKAGGGYSRLAAPRSIAPFIAVKASELVFVPQKETASGALALENKAALAELAAKVDFVVLGPGISLEREAQELARELARKIEKPLLLDGDGITALAEDLDLLRARRAATILTPHLGEMGRITRLPIAQIDADKVGVLRRTAGDLNAIIVLKGAHSLVGYPDGRVFINLSGNPGMASAGSGDVLTGTVAAMFGLGLEVPDAV
ncbi:MAG: NAD(P)H-hydrate dehydratase, partial [bacterium]